MAKTKDNAQLMSWLGRCTLRCVDSKPFATQKLLNEAALTKRFLEFADAASFTPLFHLFTPQLLAFYKARGCETALAEDLAQEVMLTVYLKAGQIRERASFRAWLFRIARNTLFRHYGKRTREVDIVDSEDAIERVPASQTGAATPAFEFMNWMELLNPRERDIMRLRFIEEWEFHEIATAQSIPIGTVLWRVFNAKKKLARHLTTGRESFRKAA